MGENKELNYSKAKALLPPDEDRFTKTQLSRSEFFEPTEMTILPNLVVLIVQRRGEILLYKNETKKVKQVGYLNVYFKASLPNLNAEEGLMCLPNNPQYEMKNWVESHH